MTASWLYAIAATAALAAAAAPMSDAKEPVTMPSAEVRSLSRGGGDCPFVQLSLLSLQVTPVPPSPNREVSDCGYVSHEGIRIERFDHVGPHGFYRIEYIKRENGTPDRFSIFLRGGPRSMTSGVGPLPFKIQLPVRLAEQSGTGVIAPSYLGTWTRSLYPRQDSDAAGREIADLSRQLSALHPRAQISVVAESAGSLVGLHMLAHRALPIVLVFPPAASLSELVTDPRGTDVAPAAAAQLSRFYRYRPGTEDPELVTVTSVDQLSAFAGSDYGKSLADLIGELQPQPRACIAIVYGTADRRVRNARLAEVRARFPSVPIRAMEGMGHGAADEEQAEALARTVREVMPARCS